MGKSDKPDIGYRFPDHQRYLAAFIEELGLTDITLVIHDWGSGLGFDYARKNEGNVRAIAFFEAMTKPLSYADMNFFEDRMFRTMRDKRDGHKMLIIDNFFIDSMMQLMTGRDLSEKELANYRAPFRTKSARKPIRNFPLDVPLDGAPVSSYETMKSYAAWLEASTIPKLLLWAQPGALIKEAEVKRLKARLTNLSTVYIGAGRHFLQEDQPTRIGTAIADWFVKSVATRTSDAQ